MKTYKDFKIGDIVTCYRHDGFFDDNITIGKKYKVEDVDFHFPHSIAIKIDRKVKNNIHFMPIEFFECRLQDEREEKLNKILNE